jgi:multidrug transporter EmrE-like cation transporter
LKADLTKNLALILCAVMLGVLGQFSMKHGMGKVVVRTAGVGALASSLAHALVQPFVTTGVALYAVSALVWLVILSRVELSFAYPMVSIGYVAVVLLSRVLFHEQVTLVRIVGTLVICVGVVLISRS